MPPSAAADRASAPLDPSTTAVLSSPPTPPAQTPAKTSPMPVETAEDFAAHMSAADVEDDDQHASDMETPAIPPEQPVARPSTLEHATDLLPPVSAPATHPPALPHTGRAPISSALSTALPTTAHQDLNSQLSGASAPASRRGKRNARIARIGRPPNINENSLMRRLECVMAVDSGRMTMLTACQQYDISARTFYRWLRNKDRLIELTGFTEDDFRSNPPWDTTPPDPVTTAGEPEAVGEDLDAQNLPRLPPQPKGAVLSTPAPAPGYMGMKRRFPKNTTTPPSALANFQPTASADDRFQSPSQAAFYARRAFTKMPSQSAVPSGDAVSADRQAARASTRMRRAADWPSDAAAVTAPSAQVQPYRPDDRRFPQPGLRDPPTAAAGSGSNSPNEPLKRRKVMRPEQAAEEGLDDPDPATAVAVSPDVRDAQAPVSPERAPDFANGAGVFPQTRQDSGARTSAVNGKTPTEAEDRESGRHRIEIMMGRRKVTIAWYHGASADDIKTSIVRRFALLPGTQWALIDKNFDEIVISAGVPSGRYTLTVFS